jgi:hypothetical protein
MKTLKSQLLILLLSLACLPSGASAQLTPSADAYTSTATPTTNFGAKTLLDVESASQTAYIQFDLSAIPAGYTSADITKATLKLYVNAVTKAGTRTSMRWPRWPAIESSKDTKRTQSVEWGSSRSCQVIEKMVSAVGIEPTTY